jgi:hypothetical protein
VGPDQIKAAAMAVVIAGAARAEDVRRYAQAFDVASDGGKSILSLPCPHCFLIGVTATLRTLTQGNAISAMRCLLCGETLPGGDFR